MKTDTDGDLSKNDFRGRHEGQDSWTVFVVELKQPAAVSS